MNLIQNTILTAVPANKKKTPSGWLSFNAPCCVHNGETQDKKKRGGIMASDIERNALRRVLGKRLEDVFRIFEPGEQHWSWWNYRHSAWERDRGWRIDQIYLSEELLNNAKSCVIDKKIRGNIQPSDHVPVMVDIHWPPEENEEENQFYLSEL